ncbi:MAG TPA: DinB family protein [Cytophagaceae bacterium]|jgi:hypothetical protein|nr:DinB family protein [Cytophagaceae bacterium]HSZ87077.1 DinB family protein [Puia sp.]
MDTTLLKKIVIDAWNTQVGRCTKLIEGLTDEQLSEEIAPNRNSGIYLVGHLTAVHDAMLPLLGFGEKLFPRLEEIFIKNPDKSSLEKPAIKKLREYWHEVNSLLTSKLENLGEEELFQRHNSVSEEDFTKEPHRNKLNIVLSRTNHLSYHLGQLALLKK